MVDEIEKWIRTLSGNEESIQRMIKEHRELEREEKRESAKDEEQAERDFSREKYEEARDETYMRPIGEEADDEDDDEDDEPINEAEREEEKRAIEGLEGHSEVVLREFGLWHKEPEVIQESKSLRESLITEPGRVSSIGEGDTDNSNGEIEILSGIYVPTRMVKKGNGERIWKWLLSNKNSLLCGIEEEDVLSIIDGR